LVVVFVVFEGCGSEDASSSSQESATLVVVGLLYLWWGAMLLVAGLCLGSDSETLSVAATDGEMDETLFSSADSDLVEVTNLEVADFSVTEDAGVDVLLASFAGAVVLVSTALLAWAYFRWGGV
jgi:hypothetical protein